MLFSNIKEFKRISVKDEKAVLMFGKIILLSTIFNSFYHWDRTSIKESEIMWKFIMILSLIESVAIYKCYNRCFVQRVY